MKNYITLFVLMMSFYGFSQNENTAYKKRVLENTEVDLISSFYGQDGDNAAITGGIGTEKLTDVASTITVSIPLNDNDIFTIDGTISAYSSASSSNVNPFDGGGSNSNRIRYEDDDKNGGISAKSAASSTSISTAGTSSSGGSPWVESSGASKSDVWTSANIGYSHASNDRNSIVVAHLNFANEFDYTSFGLGGSITKLFNEKNTEIDLKGNVYFDSWQPIYPTEIKAYKETNGSLSSGFFSGVAILNKNGAIINKNGPSIWSPFNTSLIDNTSRNTYSLSLSFSQIISKKAQFSIFLDVVQQKGWLANPMQRVYFGDRANYYIGNATSIPNYTSKSNTDVFQLADDIERLPNTRFKVPVGARLNYYINEVVSLRTYYRYYYDDWGITSHTANIELPIKISDKFTVFPTYRYYTQTAADYFAPYEELLSTNEFYTSDYDLSKFNSNQFGFGVSYTDIFTSRRIWKLGLKSVDIKYSNYKRNTGLTAGIISAGFKFVMD
ncbi:DUF3570 domain-containing protein [Lutibacter sp.]|uniref:DUF3570 domain-containing protein n=1 Tax=Lutibacter sp. TaxID=1925666 RepID=UPI001A31A167|nr:DUF3570 domain-containing protein [Lutibacter sp.]MBI9042698.1 DUF3570 domain-containing protein [Lutibacter sp.]